MMKPNELRVRRSRSVEGLPRPQNAAISRKGMGWPRRAMCSRIFNPLASARELPVVCGTVLAWVRIAKLESPLCQKSFIRLHSNRSTILKAYGEPSLKPPLESLDLPLKARPSFPPQGPQRITANLKRYFDTPDGGKPVNSPDNFQQQLLESLTFLRLPRLMSAINGCQQLGTKSGNP